MPNLTNTLVDAAGAPVVGAMVTVELIGTWSADGTKETHPAKVWSGVTNASGVWTASLPAQSSYEGSTYYIVVEGEPRLGAATHTCTVADTPSTQKLRDRLNVPIPPAPLTAATLDGSGKVPISQLPTGATSSTVTVGNDARLSDARTPTGAAGGSLSGTYPNPGIAAGAVGGTEIATAIKDPAATTAGLRTLGTGAAQATAGNDSRLSDSRTPTGTAGGDLSGTYPNPTIKTALNDPAAATPGLRTLGAGAQQAAAGNDSRLSDARTPTAHATSHAAAGGDPVTPAAIGALALTGGTVTGDVVVSGTGKAYRLKRSGSNLDLDGGGADLFLSVYTAADFTGTQRTYMRAESGAQLLHLLGKVIFDTGAFGGGVHTIDPAGDASFDGLIGKGKNGLADMRFCGRKATAGAPTTGTWVTGDAIMDSANAWHYCTAGGTPGTWT